MGRVIKNQEDHHCLTIQSDGDRIHTLVLVSGGKRCYLWVGPRDNSYKTFNGVATFSGRLMLRRFARAILDEVGEK